MFSSFFLFFILFYLFLGGLEVPRWGGGCAGGGEPPQVGFRGGGVNPDLGCPGLGGGCVWGGQSQHVAVPQFPQMEQPPLQQSNGKGGGGAVPPPSLPSPPPGPDRVLLSLSGWGGGWGGGGWGGAGPNPVWAQIRAGANGGTQMAAG